MIVPFQSHDRLLADIREMQKDRTRAHLWWLGQSGFLLQWHGVHLLLDPYLSDSLTAKYAATDKPHVRMTELVIEPARLDFIDIVASTHQHTDHLDADTLQPILNANREVTVVVPAAIQEFAAARLAVPNERLTAIDDTQTITFDPFSIYAIPAAHETIERDDLGRCRFLGYVIEFGGMAIYHSGDTIRFAGMVERLRHWNLSVALLPINGRRAERRVAGNLWGREAAELARNCNVQTAIPCHFEMFEFNTESPAEFETTCRAIGQPYKTLLAGERFSFKP